MNIINNLLKGAVIGVANIIPGVSGGTMALVLNIYERLIGAINSISASTFLSFLGLFRFSRKSVSSFRDEMRKIDAAFMTLICIGALAAIIALSKIMTYLLEQWHDPTYGFFFGLVLLSVVAPYRMIKRKNFSALLVALLAAVSVLMVSFTVSGGDKLIEKAKVRQELSVAAETFSSGSDIPAGEYFWIFSMGAVAISAMILPGVSGSFLLLLMGGYFRILRAISDRDLLLLGVFAAGCIIGLLLFTKFLNYLLSKAHDKTMSFLAGLVLGSLWMIWPFKNSVVVGSETVYLSNMIPDKLNSNEIYTILAFLAGMIIVYVLLMLEKIEQAGKDQDERS